MRMMDDSNEESSGMTTQASEPTTDNTAVMSDKKNCVEGKSATSTKNQSTLFECCENIACLNMAKEVEREVRVAVRNCVWCLTKFVKGEGLSRIRVSGGKQRKSMPEFGMRPDFTKGGKGHQWKIVDQCGGKNKTLTDKACWWKSHEHIVRSEIQVKRSASVNAIKATMFGGKYNFEA